MSLLHGLAVTIHILAAALWIGGMAAFALVVVPAARRSLGEGEARSLLRAVGFRFASVGWWALGVLFVTGVANLGFRGVLPLIATGAFWRTPFGSTLAAKLTFVVFVVLASLAHAREAKHPSPTGRARASRLGRATLVLSTVVVLFGVFLVRGAPW